MSILKDIAKSGKYKHLMINRSQMLQAFKLTSEDATTEVMDLTSMGDKELSELLVISLMWMEHINEILGTAKQLRGDEQVEMDRVYNEAVKRLSSTTDMKVTEAKSAAKAETDYIDAQRNFNTLDAYVDYLDRLLVNIDKYHYVVKSRVDNNRNIEKKY